MCFEKNPLYKKVPCASSVVAVVTTEVEMDVAVVEVSLLVKSLYKSNVEAHFKSCYQEEITFKIITTLFASNHLNYLTLKSNRFMVIKINPKRGITHLLLHMIGYTL